MKEQIIDRKNALTFAILSLVKAVAVRSHFKSIEVINRELIPTDRPFLLVSNHISRWDGLLVYHVLNRPSNFMVHPNELKGLQGFLLTAMGAFPAIARLNLQSHVKRQVEKGESIVVFPEGDIYRDGTTHKFKNGIARFGLNLAKDGLDTPIVPIAIHYSEDGLHAKVMVAPPVSPSEYLDNHAGDVNSAMRPLTERLHREVSHLRLSLGALHEAAALFMNRPRKAWAESRYMRVSVSVTEAPATNVLVRETASETVVENGAAILVAECCDKNSCRTEQVEQSRELVGSHAGRESLPNHAA